MALPNSFLTPFSAGKNFEDQNDSRGSFRSDTIKGYFSWKVHIIITCAVITTFSILDDIEKWLANEVTNCRFSPSRASNIEEP